MATQKKLKRLNYSPEMDSSLHRNFEIIQNNFEELFNRFDSQKYVIGPTGYTEAINNTSFSVSSQIATAGLEVTIDVIINKPVLIFIVPIPPSLPAAVPLNSWFFVSSVDEPSALMEFRIKRDDRLIHTDIVGSGDTTPAGPSTFKHAIGANQIRATDFPGTAGVVRYYLQARTRTSAATGSVLGGAVRMVAIQLL